MSGWVTLPASSPGGADAAGWIRRALDLAAAMPPKPVKR